MQTSLPKALSMGKPAHGVGACVYLLFCFFASSVFGQSIPQLGIVDETYPSGRIKQDDFRYREVQIYDIRDSFPLYLKITEYHWTNSHWDYSVEGIPEVLQQDDGRIKWFGTR